MKLNISNPKIELFNKARILFSLRGCPYCRLYDEFVQRYNANLPPNKQIEVIDCTDYHDYGVLTDKRIPLFLKYYEGSYPTVFFDGGIIRGANSVEELTAWFKARLEDDFIVEENMFVDLDGEEIPLTFRKNCRFIKKGWFKKRIQCLG